VERQPILLRNGSIVDGTGTPARIGSVLLEDDRIAGLGTFDPPADARQFDCTGLTIAPGFIDSHTHSDLQAVEGRGEKVAQGVTTEVVGN
jgi:N-acyl-D-amino-acid deacylase